jgi:hypothetical protein
MSQANKRYAAGFLITAHNLLEQVNRNLVAAHNELTDQDKEQLREKIDSFRKVIASHDLM